MLATFKAAVTNFFLSPTLNAALPFAALAAALWRGGWRARAIALVNALQWLSGLIWRLPAQPSHRTALGVRALTGDLVLLGVCLLAVRGARRYWVVVVAGLVLLTVGLDVMLLATPDGSPYPYMRANVLVSYAKDLVLIWASLSTERAPRAAGPWQPRRSA